MRGGKLVSRGGAVTGEEEQTALRIMGTTEAVIQPKRCGERDGSERELSATDIGFTQNLQGCGALRVLRGESVCELERVLRLLLAKERAYETGLRFDGSSVGSCRLTIQFGGASPVLLVEKGIRFRQRRGVWPASSGYKYGGRLRGRNGRRLRRQSVTGGERTNDDQRVQFHRLTKDYERRSGATLPLGFESASVVRVSCRPEMQLRRVLPTLSGLRSAGRWPRTESRRCAVWDTPRGG